MTMPKNCLLVVNLEDSYQLSLNYLQSIIW